MRLTNSEDNYLYRRSCYAKQTLCHDNLWQENPVNMRLNEMICLDEYLKENLAPKISPGSLPFILDINTMFQECANKDQCQDTFKEAETALKACQAAATSLRRAVTDMKSLRKALKKMKATPTSTNPDGCRSGFMS